MEYRTGPNGETIPTVFDNLKEQTPQERILDLTGKKINRLTPSELRRLALILLADSDQQTQQLFDMLVGLGEDIKDLEAQKFRELYEKNQELVLARAEATKYRTVLESVMARVIELDEARNRPILEEPAIEGTAVEILEANSLEVSKTPTRLGGILKRVTGMFGLPSVLFK